MDPIVLHYLRLVLNIKSKVRCLYRKSKPFKDKNISSTPQLDTDTTSSILYYILDTTGKQTIYNLCTYCDNHFHTIKSLEFKI